ncbi:unnamed protein product [Cercospora beticola]|nr:unnamed protein product [Cercospora beticola]
MEILSALKEARGGAVAPTPSLTAAPGLHFSPTPQPRPLKDEVEDLLRPRRYVHDKPPYTIGQMIVMILVVHDLEPHPVEFIHFQILVRFGYYTTVALAGFASQLNTQASSEFDRADIVHALLGPVLPGLYQAVNHFDLPLTRTSTDEQERDITRDKFMISASAAARAYLRDIFEPPRQGTFDFMALPAELREKIYKMLLVYPKPGFTLADHEIWRGDDYESLHQFGLLSREDVAAPAYPESLDQEDSPSIPENDIPVESLTKTLAILSVSKQIRHEALPVFYGQNSFHFGTLDHFLRTLETMEHDTIQQIAKLRVSMDYHDLCLMTPFSTVIDTQLSYLSPKKLVLILPYEDRYYGTRFAEECWRGNLDGMERLESLIALAKRAGNVEIRDNDVFGDLLREGIEGPEVDEEVEDESKSTTSDAVAELQPAS